MTLHTCSLAHPHLSNVLGLQDLICNYTNKLSLRTLMCGPCSSYQGLHTGSNRITLHLQRELPKNTGPFTFPQAGTPRTLDRDNQRV